MTVESAETRAFRTTCKHPKVYRVDAPEVEGIKNKFVIVTEKIDGSQIGFGKVDGVFVIRSKETRINPEQPTGLFANAAKALMEIKDNLPDNVFFYGETLNAPRHNKLRYGRVPAHHVIIFGMRDHYGSMVSDIEIEVICRNLGLERVPVLFRGNYDEDAIREAMKGESCLGKAQMEGVVIRDDRDMWAKIVRDDFKEVRNDRVRLLKQGDERLQEFFDSYATEARWEKARQHLTESGVLQGKSSDLGLIIREVSRDIEDEEELAIKDFLYKHFRKQLLKRATAGIPAWFFGAKGEV